MSPSEIFPIKFPIFERKLLGQIYPTVFSGISAATFYDFIKNSFKDAPRNSYGINSTSKLLDFFFNFSCNSLRNFFSNSFLLVLSKDIPHGVPPDIYPIHHFQESIKKTQQCCSLEFSLGIFPVIFLHEFFYEFFQKFPINLFLEQYQGVPSSVPQG